MTLNLGLLIVSSLVNAKFVLKMLLIFESSTDGVIKIFGMDLNDKFLKRILTYVLPGISACFLK